MPLYPPPSAGGGGAAVTASASNGSFTAGLLAFSNANGLTFGTSAGSIISASYNSTQFQLTGNYLTTAMASNRGSDFMGTNTALTANGVSMTANSSGLSLNFPAFLTTAMQSNAATISNINVSGGTTSSNLSAFKLIDSNGVSWSVDTGSKIYATVKTDYQSSNANYLTSQSNQNVTAGNGGFAFQTLSFSNANGMSFGTSAGSAITGSYTVPLTAGLLSAINVSAGTTSSNQSSIGFSNANGLSFGFSGASITGSYTTPTQSNQTMGVYASSQTVGQSSSSTFDARSVTFRGAGIVSVGMSGGEILISGVAAGAGDGVNILAAGTQTANTTGTVKFADSNGISFGMSNSSQITASYTVPSTAGLLSAINVSAGTTSSNQSSIGFSNGNGMSFGFSGASITGSYTVPTVTNSVWTVSDAATSGTVARLAFTNLNGVTLSLSSGAAGSHTIVGSHNGLTSQSNQNVTAGNGGFAFQTLSFSNVNGFSFGTSAGSAITGSYTVPTVTDYFSKTNTTFNGANISGSISFNTAGLQLSMSVAAPGGGVTPAASASNGSFNFTTLNFSNANNVTFGTSAGGIITASVAAPGAAAENNWVNLLGANTAGNTTASGSTIGYSGINLTLSGTNGSVVNISAPATSSISGTGGIGISTNGSTISIGMPLFDVFEPVPMLQANSTTYLPGQGTWHIQPLVLPLGVNSGRINVLHSFGSTSNLFAASNGTSFASGTTGGASYSFALSKKVALFSLDGTGTNSTRLASFWSSQWTMGASHSMGLSLTNASQLTGQRQLAMNYIASIGSDGGTTGGTISATHNASFANSSTATSAYTSAMSSIYNYISGAVLIPIPFNTSLSAGNYWIGEQYSTASTTAGTSVNGASIYPMINQVAIYGMASMSHRQWGITASSTGSQYFPGKGIYSLAQAAPPATIAFSDIRSLASHQFNYYNIIQSGASI